MSESREHTVTLRALGEPDPIAVPMEGEEIRILRPAHYGKTGPARGSLFGVFVILEVLTPQQKENFKFFISEKGLTRFEGDSRIRGGLYRAARMQAMNQAIDLVKTKRAPGGARLPNAEVHFSYNDLMSSTERVEDMKVGPSPLDEQSLALYVELLTGQGKKVITFFQNKNTITIHTDGYNKLDEGLRKKLFEVARSEFRRLGAPIKS